MPPKTVKQDARDAQQPLFVTQELMPAEALDEPFATQETTPEAAPEVKPEATAEATAEAAPEVKPEATAEVKPEATAEDGEMPTGEMEEPFVTHEVTPGGGGMPANLQEMVERNIELRRDNRDLKDRTDRNTAELAQLDKLIIEQFAARRIQKQTMDTGETMYVQKSVYASLVRDEDGEHDGAHKALRDNGLEWLVEDNVNSNSLSGWVREQRKQESEIPEGMLPFLNISEVYRLKVRM